MLQPISNIKPTNPYEYDESVTPTEYVSDYEYYSEYYNSEEDCNDISDEEKAAWEDWSERMDIEELPW